MRNYFPKRPSGAPLHTLSKLYDVPVGFVTPPYFEAEYCLFCGRRRVAVARYRMICLVLADSSCLQREESENYKMKHFYPTAGFEPNIYRLLDWQSNVLSYWGSDC